MHSPSLLSACIYLLSLPGGVCSNPILEDVFGELVKYYEGVPETAVRSILAEAVQRAAIVEGLPTQDLQCLRDYNRACPEGWADVGDADNCAAPPHYAGACPQQMSYGALTPGEKSSQAAQCDAAFPCAGTCVQDYNHVCPLHWIAGSSHECISPVAYDGPCVRRQRFTTLNNLEKKLWAQACNVVWPCRSSENDTTLHRAQATHLDHGSCFVDYSANCPEQWILNARYCTAPSNYRGRCSLFIDSSQMTRDQKQAYGDVCNTPWPCITNLSK